MYRNVSKRQCTISFSHIALETGLNNLSEFSGGDAVTLRLGVE
jgi:hypothetical protein